MKTMTRKQLAEHAGVTTQTLKNWMGPHLDYLHSIGMPTGKGALPLITIFVKLERVASAD